MFLGQDSPERIVNGGHGECNDVSEGGTRLPLSEALSIALSDGNTSGRDRTTMSSARCSGKSSGRRVVIVGTVTGAGVVEEGERNARRRLHRDTD